MREGGGGSGEEGKRRYEVGRRVRESRMEGGEKGVRE
jgi:hypothetical protein